MNHSEFKPHLNYIRTVLTQHIDSDQHWFQYLANNQSSLTLRHNYPISIKPAKHGRGLFSDSYIPIDTVVTLYPAHYLCVKVKGDTHTVIHPQGLPPIDPAYRISLNDIVSFTGCPEITDNPWFFGHMPNDPCDISLLKKGKEHKFLQHYSVAVHHANVRFHTEHDCIYLVSTRPIKAGDEIVVAYGPDYWFTRAGLVKK